MKSELTDIQRVIEAWKIFHDIPRDDKGWDKEYYPHYSKRAKSLINLFGGWKGAIHCMEYMINYFQSKNLDYTMDTIVKRADVYREYLGGKRGIPNQ